MIAGARGRGTRIGVLIAALFFALVSIYLPAAPVRAQVLSPDFLAGDKSMGANERAGLWKEWDKQAQGADELIRSGAPSPEDFARVRADIEAQRKDAEQISATAGEEISRLTKQLEALGPQPTDGEKEPLDVSKLRGELSQRIAGAKAIQGRADQVVVRAVELQSSMSNAAQRRFVDLLTTPGPSPINIVNWRRAGDASQKAISDAGAELRRRFDTPEERAHLTERGPITFAFFVLVALAGLALRGVVTALLGRATAQSTRRGRKLALGVGAAFARPFFFIVAGLALVIGVVALDLLGPTGMALLKGAGGGLGEFIVVYAIAATFFSPQSAALRVARLDDATARAAYRASLLLGASLLYDGIVSDVAPIVSAPAEATAIFSFIAILIGSVALWRLSAACRADIEAQPGAQVSHALLSLRRALIVVAALAPLLAMFGYEFAARFLFFPFVYSLGVIATGYMIFRVVGETVDIYLADSESPQEGAATERESLRLIPIFAGFLLICAGAPILALVWGASFADLDAGYRLLAAGLVVGEVAISPADFFVFALVFAAGYMLTRATQGLLKGSVLPKTRMSEGGAEALVSVLGYIGFFIAGIVGVSAAGIDLSNLAIVIGALSVGVGLGLQNIVGNFVSGVILLIERPVKVGDWIEVGGVHGYVRKVNVRSTEIETFDRSSYILPNSDLISGPVTNFTHSDKVGRVIVPVGVAYGVDTRMVERLLLELGRAHPMVMTSPPSVAHFMRFGSDALEFELRVMIRDVNWMLSVKSDLNHAIAARLAEEGLGIPYPQRDLHIRSLGPLEAALKTRRAAGRQPFPGEDDPQTESDMGEPR